MKKIISSRFLMILTMFFGALSVSWADNRFYAESVNFEPGETKQIAFNLDNTQEFYGFQFDITLPEGLEFGTVKDKVDFTLSSRVNSSYTSVSNLLSTNTLRIGAFSANHTAISGDSGILLYLNVKAAESFEGGTLTISNILFTDASDNDVSLPDVSLYISNIHDNRFYIPDFSISIGETKEISLVLANETQFTAFQTDIYLPEGLEIVDNSWVRTDRCSGHTISGKIFDDGRVRLTCFSFSNTVFTGNDGALVSLQITASKEAAETCSIEMKNQRFSTKNSKEYSVENSSTVVNVERIPLTGISLNTHELTLNQNQTFELAAQVEPADATGYDISWSSSNEAVATVDNGIINAVGMGECIITVTGNSNTGTICQDQCTVKVRKLSGIISAGVDDGVIEIAGDSIFVKGLASGKDVAVYTVAGKCIWRERSHGEAMVFKVANGQTYIVTIDGIPTKVAVL